MAGAGRRGRSGAMSVCASRREVLVCDHALDEDLELLIGQVFRAK